MLTDVEGIRVGHWTHLADRTGCTVVLFPAGTTASAEIRGGAPATRELDLLVPERLVDRVDAVLLTGGSAFGLAAADGVVTWLADAGIGYPTPAGPVPIVPTLALYDLSVGSATTRPGPKQGRAACAAAEAGRIPLGLAGAGTGCTVGKWRGPDAARPGGLGSATCRAGDLVVSALVAVNASGDVLPVGAMPAGMVLPSEGGAEPVQPFGNTTIGVIATNGRFDKAGCLLLAQSGHDGMARAIFPSHTRSDGDALVAAATGAVDASIDQARVLAIAAVEAAIRTVAPPAG
ncbi:MAG: peptidase DmpA [Acidimicrobiales bacterium]|nr:peptidase DmpA [Acidimicrobiales bacterium]